jgi:hypothetical protein
MAVGIYVVIGIFGFVFLAMSLPGINTKTK